MTNEECVSMAKEMIRLMESKGVAAPIDAITIGLQVAQYLIRMSASSRANYLPVAKLFCESLIDGFKELYESEASNGVS